MDPYDQAVMQRKKNRKRYMLMGMAMLVLVAVAAAIAVGVTKSRNKNSERNNGRGGGFQTTSKSLQALCAVTLYRDVCESTVTSSSGYSQDLSVNGFVALILQVALNHTQKALADMGNWTAKVADPVQKVALADCLDLLDESVTQLNDSVAEVQRFDLQSLTETSGDSQSWLSAALTNVETCADGFANTTDGDLKTKIANTTAQLRQLASNALAVIHGIAGVVTKLQLNLNVNIPSRRLLSVEDEMMQSLDEEGLPGWLVAGDRRLLQVTTVKANVVVAKDGSGKYKTIQEAIDDAPSNSKSRYVILVKKGTYVEQVNVPKSKQNIMLLGQGMDATIVTGRKSVADGTTTFRSATFATVGTGFIARDIQLANTAGTQKHQAVALRVGADKSVFYGCKISGNQDTLYAHSLRQFYRECTIIGTVDFIFGNAASIFQSCSITPTKPMPGQQCTVTAQGRTDPNQNTGIIIHRSTIKGTASLEAAKSSVNSYLGRPWKQYSRTVVMLTYFGDIINSAGWLQWSGDFALNTLTYREYNNNGPGSSTAKRVKWGGYRVITRAAEAAQYTVSRFIGKSIPKGVGVPYVAGI